MDGPFYCPQCGYDQRGQPVDGLCPECGAAGASIEAARIDRWAEYAAVDLWGIALLQSVGAVFGLVGLGLLAAGQWVGGLLVGSSFLPAGGGSLWYLVILVRYLRQRSRPNFRNLTSWRRRQLRWWLTLDLALVAIPPIAWLVWGSV